MPFEDPDAAIDQPDATVPVVDASVIPDAATADAAPPTPLTFRLRYEPPGPNPPDQAIYVEHACSQMWVSVIDGEGNWITIDSDCGQCSCDTCATSCAICDCAFLIEPIFAGGMRDHDWDGVTHPSRNDPGCGWCTYTSTLPAGTYTAHFCWSLTSDGGSPQCADHAFTYPMTGIIEHVVTAP